MFVALDVIVIGTVSAIVHVHVHGNDTVGVIGSVDDRAASMEATTVNVSLAAG